MSKYNNMINRIKKAVKALVNPSPEDVIEKINIIDTEIKKGKLVLELLHKEYDEFSKACGEELEKVDQASKELIHSRWYDFEKDHLLAVGLITSKINKAREVHYELAKGLDPTLFINDDEFNTIAITLTKGKESNQISDKDFQKGRQNFVNLYTLRQLLKVKVDHSK